MDQTFDTFSTTDTSPRLLLMSPRVGITGMELEYAVLKNGFTLAASQLLGEQEPGQVPYASDYKMSLLQPEKKKMVIIEKIN